MLLVQFWINILLSVVIYFNFRLSYRSNQLFHALELSQCWVINSVEGVVVLSGGLLIKGHGISQRCPGYKPRRGLCSTLSPFYLWFSWLWTHVLSSKERKKKKHRSVAHSAAYRLPSFLRKWLYVLSHSRLFLLHWMQGSKKKKVVYKWPLTSRCLIWELLLQPRWWGVVSSLGSHILQKVIHVLPLSDWRKTRIHMAS